MAVNTVIHRSTVAQPIILDMTESKAGRERTLWYTRNGAAQNTILKRMQQSMTASYDSGHSEVSDACTSSLIVPGTDYMHICARKDYAPMCQVQFSLKAPAQCPPKATESTIELTT